MYGYESWPTKKAECWRIDAFELWCWRKLLRVPRTARRSNQGDQINPKGNQPWFHWKDWCWNWSSNTLEAKSRLIGKDFDVGKDWGQEKGTEDEMVEWHHQTNGHEFEQTLGDSEGQGSLACCSPYVQKDSDTTEQLKNNRISLGIIPLNIRGTADIPHFTPTTFLSAPWNYKPGLVSRLILNFEIPSKGKYSIWKDGIRLFTPLAPSADLEGMLILSG